MSSLRSHRTSLLALPVAVALLAAPVVSLPGGGGGPTATAVAETALADEAAVVASSTRPDGRIVEVRQLEPDDEFAMVGVVWDQEADLAEAPVQVRTDSGDGGWSPWTTLTPSDDGPDPGTAEARQARPGTGSLWTGDATQVQVRTTREPGATVDGTTVVTVSTGDGAPELDDAPLSSARAASSSPQVVSRAQWGADESMRTCAPTYAPALKAAVVHHTADSNDYGRDDVARILRADYAYHVTSRGWCDLGYNALVDKFGRVYEGRAGGLDRNVVGAHASGFNTGTFGISMIGNHDLVPPTAAEAEAVSRTIAWRLSASYVDPRASVTLTSAGGTARWPAGTKVTLPTIVSHRDVGTTACPGRYAWSLMDAFRGRVAELTAAAGTSATQRAWAARGGSGGWLGPVTRAESVGPLATSAGFAGGDLYTSGYGTASVRNAFRDTYAAEGGERSVLGVPIADERAVPGGAAQEFSGNWSSLYWSPASGTQAVMGGIRERWNAEGAQAGRLGFPTSPERDVAGVPVGRWSGFQGGDVYWSPGPGAKVLVNGIRDHFLAMGGSARLGVPVEDERVLDGTIVRQRFSSCSSVIYWSAATGSAALRCAIADRYESIGAHRSVLGLPTTDEFATPTGAAVDFQRGSITWDAATGTISVVTR